MRCTIVIAAFAVQAFAQTSILPITQISDGQIQAPPATSVIPGSTNIIPTTGVPIPIPSGSDIVIIPGPSGSDTIVIPGPSGSDTIVVPVPSNSVTLVVPTTGAPNGTVPTSSGIFSNSTASITSGSNAPTGSGTAPPAASTTPPPGNAAATNMASFGGMAIAIAAMVFA